MPISSNEDKGKMMVPWYWLILEPFILLLIGLAISWAFLSFNPNEGEQPIEDGNKIEDELFHRDDN